MVEGHFYFLMDQYYKDFPNQGLMFNKETVNGKPHNRPCFYLYQDTTTGLYWMIPLSSKVQKYEEIYNHKVSKYGQCDTIVFAEILGHKKAFLIQNICPASEKYIGVEYTDKNNVPVRIPGNIEEELRKKAKKIISLVRQGKKLVFPDILVIEKTLLNK